MSRMNPEIYDEPIPYQNNRLSIKIFRQVRPYFVKPQRVLWHYHKEIELLHIQEGCLEMRTPHRQYRLEPGDVLLLGPSELHSTWGVSTERAVYLTLHFDLQAFFDAPTLMYYRFFSGIDGPLSRMNDWFPAQPELREEIGRIAMEIQREMELRPKGYDLAVAILIKQLLLTLLRSSPEETERTGEPLPADSLRPVIDYVDRNLAKKIEMEPVSRMMNMSYHYFSKYFKKVMGLSFTEYVNRQRIKKAERLLLAGSDTVAAVAEQAGFTNMAHFYELFRRYNRCSPKEYVRKLTSPAKGKA